MTKNKVGRKHRRPDGGIASKHIGSSFDDWLKEEGFHDLLKKRGKGKATKADISAVVDQQREARHRAILADRCLSLSDAAKAIGIPRSQLLDLIERAQIEWHRDGRSMRIMGYDCMRYKERLQFKSKGGVLALMGSLPAVDSGRRGHVLRDDIYRDSGLARCTIHGETATNRRPDVIHVVGDACGNLSASYPGPVDAVRAQYPDRSTIDDSPINVKAVPRTHTEFIAQFARQRGLALRRQRH